MLVLHLVGSMGLILGTWVVLSLLLAAVGMAARRAFGSQRIDASSLWQDFWMGLALTLLALQLWHLFLPINWLPVCLLTLFGFIVLLRFRKEVGGVLVATGLGDKAALAATLVVWMWFANRAMSPPLLYDTGMYHMPGVLWSKAFAIVPGLGNLHGRLAFNNSNLLLGAMLDAGIWSGRAAHIASGLLLFVLAGRYVPAGVRLARRNAQPSDAFDFILLVGVAHLALRRQLISFSPGLAATAAAFAAGSMLYRWLTDRTDHALGSYGLVVIVTLLVASVTIKLTIFGFAAPAAILATAVWVRQRVDDGPRRRAAVWLVTLATVLTCVWLLRGVILSGFPAYPSTLFGFDVDWSVPELQAEAERAWTVAWGQTRDLELLTDGVSNEWLAWVGALFRTGFRGTLWSVAVPCLFAIGLMPLAVLRARTKASSLPTTRGWLPLIAAVIGLAFWLLTTAVVRHGLPVAWLMAATVSGQLLIGGPAQSRRRWQTFILTCGVIIGMSAVAQYSVRLMILDRVPWWAAAGGLLTRPGADLGLHSEPVPTVERYATQSGLILTVPSRDNRCWAVGPPCTPHPAANLRLRVPGDLGSGFATDGSWLQERWPTPRSDFRERFLRSREVRER